MSDSNNWENEPFDAMDLFDLAEELRDRTTEGQELNDATFGEVSEEYFVPLSDVYAALSLVPELNFRRNFETLFQVCVGRCQFNGGAPLLRKLIEMKGQQQLPVDVVAVSCLDCCDDAPVLRSSGPNGTYNHPKITPEGLQELIDTLLREPYKDSLRKIRSGELISSRSRRGERASGRTCCGSI